MDFNKLELLLDISNTHNLTISAENFGYTQSAVSHAIKKLEAEAGFPLLKRTNRGVELTNDGRALLPSIRKVVTSYRRLMEETEAIQGIQRGSICIGTYSSIAINWLPEIIRNFQRQYPQISIQIREGGLTEIEQWMNDSTVDFGLISKVGEQPFDFTVLTEEPLYAVFPSNYELPDDQQQAFPIAAFRDHLFITAETGVDNDVMAALEQADVVPPVSFYCKDDHSIISMVEHGLGISLLPALILEGSHYKIKKIPLEVPVYRTLGIGVVSEDALSLSAKAFIQMTKEYMQQR